EWLLPPAPRSSRSYRRFRRILLVWPTPGQQRPAGRLRIARAGEKASTQHSSSSKPSMSAYLFPCCAAAKSNRHATSSRAACNLLSLTAGFSEKALELRRRNELHVRISARSQELPVRRHDVASSARDSGFDEPQVTRVLQA